MRMTIRLLGAPLPAMLIFHLIPIPMILVTMIMTVVFAETSYPFGLKSDCGGQGSVLLVNATEKMIHLSILAETCNNLLFLSDQPKFWTSKFTVRDGDQLIDVSSTAQGANSTIPIGST
jgi:hypothetical protein